LGRSRASTTSATSSRLTCASGSLAARARVRRCAGAMIYFDQYKSIPGVDMKPYDDRLKDVTKAVKRAEKRQKKSAAGSGL